jgi:hypothetical protein
MQFYYVTLVRAEQLHTLRPLFRALITKNSHHKMGKQIYKCSVVILLLFVQKNIQFSFIIHQEVNFNSFILFGSTFSIARDFYFRMVLRSHFYMSIYLSVCPLMYQISELTLINFQGLDQQHLPLTEIFSEANKYFDCIITQFEKVDDFEAYVASVFRVRM